MPKLSLIRLLIHIFILFILFLGWHSPVWGFYFWDAENSPANYLGAGSIDLGLYSAQPDFSPSTAQFSHAHPAKRDIYVQNSGSLDFNFSVFYQFLGGNQDFCQALSLKVWHYGQPRKLLYSGLLSEFTGFAESLNSLNLLPGHKDWLHFQVSLDTNISWDEEQVCRFSFVFLGQQPGLSAYTGFWDQETITNSIIYSPQPEPQIDPFCRQPCTSYGFILRHIKNYSHIRYRLSYIHQAGSRRLREEIRGRLDNSSAQDSIACKNLYLGTCSGADCTAHRNISNITLEVVLLGRGLPNKTLRYQDLNF